MPKQIKIMIAEDHSMVRHGIISSLNEIKDFNVIGEASNGKEILKLIRRNQPDILISDIEMPEMNGYQLVEIINQEFRSIKIIFISMYYSSSYAAESLKNGINAFLPKECDFCVLEEAIRIVYKNSYYFNSGVSSKLISGIMAESRFEAMRNQLALNHRETEILKLICEGKINREIGELLNLTSATIDFHRQSIYKKTEISSVALLVKYAIQNGITTLY